MPPYVFLSKTGGLAGFPQPAGKVLLRGSHLRSVRGVC
jgi:hypothetical protein